MNVALWGSATLIAQHRLNMLLATYRAAGEPVHTEDFDTHKDIPDDGNAANYYLQAEEAYIWPASLPIELSDFDLIRAARSDNPNSYADEIGRFISTNAVTLELLEKGANCDRAEWQGMFADPLSSSGLDKALAARSTGKLLSIAIRASHCRDRSKEMLDFLYAQARLAGHRTSIEGSVINHLVTTSITMLSCEAVEETGAKMADGIRMEDRAYCKKRSRQIVAEFLNDVGYSNAFRSGLISERVVLLDLYEAIPSGKPIDGFFSGAPRSFIFLIYPTLISHCRRTLESVDQVVAASRFSTYPEVMSAIDHVSVPAAWWGIDRILPDYIASPEYDETMRVEYTRLSRRRMAAIALSIHMYELENGRRPETLQELVPEYFETVPLDPFHEGDVPVKYLPSANPPVLYCIGPDGIDDGGLFGRRDGENEDSKNLDLLFFLDGDRPLRNP
ncbi:MAG TPA: hypothetical protein PKN33_21160 [Phycisphaerae bacterium]|nr:hypothetical protein [Phycisphaerae bacterium]